MSNYYLACDLNCSLILLLGCSVNWGVTPQCEKRKRSNVIDINYTTLLWIYRISLAFGFICIQYVVDFVFKPRDVSGSLIRSERGHIFVVFLISERCATVIFIFCSVYPAALSLLSCCSSIFAMKCHVSRCVAVIDSLSLFLVDDLMMIVAFFFFSQPVSHKILWHRVNAFWMKWLGGFNEPRLYNTVCIGCACHVN